MSSLLERDAKVTWHPYTQMGKEPFCLPIVRGEGALLYGENGESYIDAISSWWVTLHGHAHPRIVAAIARQAGVLEQVIFAGCTHEPAVSLAEALLSSLSPSIHRIFYSDNGSTAVEVALKLAIQYWQKRGEERATLVAFKESYHGDTFGAMSASARGLFTKPFWSRLFNVVHITPPIPGCEAASYEEARALCQSKGVAAFIYEPLVQGAGGMLMHTEEGLQRVLKEFRGAGALLIADEVLTGFARTGDLFASHTIDVPPDLICLSKGLTGGFMPLGVTGVNERIFEAFLSDDRKEMFFHGHSFTGNPLACAAALESFTLLQSEETKRAHRKLCSWQEEFAQKLSSHRAVSNVRYRGTIVAFEVTPSQGEVEGYFNSIRDLFTRECVKRGVLLRPLGNMIYVMPPYCTSRTQLERIYGAIGEILDLIGSGMK